MKYIQNLFGWSLYSWMIYSLIITFLVLESSCKSKSPNTSHSESSSQKESIESDQFTSLPPDFKEFYIKFHEDSLYQISKIHFPLEGLPEQADPEFIGEEAFFWSADQWIFQKNAFPDKKKFLTEYTNVVDMLIEEKIHDLQFGLIMIRRFSKGSDGWSLIYYAGMNKYRSASDSQK
ncbi:MAG: hypothetical protein IPO62_03300 [Saprospiraceae bacterium]|nr:hypothetical protein [Saprospiraceae bacterium]MBK9630087.1 hypothetical protein [Saprospiraceae bacterium]